MNHEIPPVPWEQYSDESAHYSYVRCLSYASHYEVVRVTHDPDGPQAEFVHQIIFMSEYDEPALARILHDFGYASLDAFVREVNHAGASPADFITVLTAEVSAPAVAVEDLTVPMAWPLRYVLSSLGHTHSF